MFRDIEGNIVDSFKILAKKKQKKKYRNNFVKNFSNEFEAI